MEWYEVGLIMGGALLVLLFSGLPIAVALGLVSAGFVLATVGPDKSYFIIGNEFTGIFTRYGFAALPLFILMGQLFLITGTVNDIFDVVAKWFRALPGGLALVSVGTCAIFATLSGASIAATAALGGALIPEMLDRGYSKRLATGVIGAAGGLAHLIPPSNAAITYAILIEGSPGRQLMAGAIPGFILAFGYAIVVIVWVLRNPSAARKEPPVSWRERFVVLRKIVAPVLIVIAVLGSMLAGITTATEAAGIGAFSALLLALVSRKLNRNNFGEALRGTIRAAAFILFIVAGAKLYGWVLTYYLIPQHVIDMALGLTANPWIILIMIQVGFLIMGTFLDMLGMMMISVPLLLPLVVALGFDPIWFGVLFFINAEMGLVTPPVGFHLYIIKGVTPKDVTIGDILKGCAVFFAADFAVLALVMAIPQLALWLPELMLG